MIYLTQLPRPSPTQQREQQQQHARSRGCFFVFTRAGQGRARLTGESNRRHGTTTAPTTALATATATNQLRPRPDKADGLRPPPPLLPPPLLSFLPRAAGMATTRQTTGPSFPVSAYTFISPAGQQANCLHHISLSLSPPVCPWPSLRLSASPLFHAFPLRSPRTLRTPASDMHRRQHQHADTHRHFVCVRAK